MIEVSVAYETDRAVLNRASVRLGYVRLEMNKKQLFTVRVALLQPEPRVLCAGRRDFPHVRGLDVRKRFANLADHWSGIASHVRRVMHDVHRHCERHGHRWNHQRHSNGGKATIYSSFPYVRVGTS